MIKLLFTIFAIIGGLAISLQASINGGLGKRIGTIETSFVSFAIGTLALLFMTIFLGKGNILAVGTAPKWQLTGGLLGALYVFVTVLVVPKLGVASTIMAVIVGQLLMGAVIDHFGLLGGKQIPFDMKRASAMLLFFAAIYLFYRK